MLITENENPNLISVDVDLVSAPELDIDEDFGNTSTPTETERLFNFDIDCQTLGSDDVHLQQITSDLDIPMDLDEDTQLTCTGSGSGSGSDHGSLFPDSFLDPMYGMDDFIDPFRVWDNETSQNILPNFPEYVIKEEIDMSTASSEFINENSDSWLLQPLLDSKCVLETPPISPPSQASSSSSSSENSPPSTPSPPLKNISSPSPPLTFSPSPGPVMVVSHLSNLMGSNINNENNVSPILQIASSSTHSPRKRFKIVPKPESSLLPSATLNTISKSQAETTSRENKSNGTKPSTTRTIVLSAQDFAALTNQVKQNPVAPTIKIQTVPSTAAPIPSDSQMVDIPKTVIKTEPIVTSPKKALSPPQPPITLSVGATTQGRKQELEIKAIKRQQRMIKNRESACLSRKKKKEYVTSLENQITELHKENIQIKLENIALKERLKIYEENATWKRPSLQARKTTIVLVVLLVVSFNLGYSALWTNRNSLNWPEPDPSFFSKRQIVKNPPNIHSKPVSSASSLPKARLTRVLLWNPQSSEEEYDSITNATRSMMCPMYINQTESIRLDSELRRWIGVENSTTKISRQLSVPRKESNITSSIFFPRLKKRLRTNRKKSSPAINAVELYYSRSQYTQYASFFDAIHRRDDTFYVVSFSGDHLLLPALAHNKTLRPKMALVFPALPINESVSSSPTNHITMMQIDCEVINTQLVHLKEVDVPEHLLRNRNATTSPSPSHPRSNPPGNNPHRAAASKPSYPQRYRPYFVKDESELVQETDQVLYTAKARKYIQKKFP